MLHQDFIISLSLEWQIQSVLTTVKPLITWFFFSKVFTKTLHRSPVRTRRPSHEAYFDRIRNLMKIQNSLVLNILDRPQRYFAHVTTVTLSWPVQNIVVIGHIHFTLECFEFSSNFEFDRNMLSGTGARWGMSLWVHSLNYILLLSSSHSIQYSAMINHVIRRWHCIVESC